VDELLNHAPCGFISFADDGTITLVNDTLLEMIGYEHGELVGRAIENIFSIGTRIFYQTHFFPLIRMHGHAEEIFLILRCKDGSDAGVLANAMRKERAGVVAIDCIFIRVRERQKFEAELIRARKDAEVANEELRVSQEQLVSANYELERQAAELEISSEELQVLNDQMEERMIELERLKEVADEASRAKSNFLAMMSHELRTPLNAIAGYAQILEMGIQGPVSEPQIQSLQRIQQSQRHLLRLVNEILNLSRIEAGQVDYELTDIAGRDLISRITPLVEPQMQQSAITLVIEVPADIILHCDVDKTHQILINLLSNATKFTPSGGVITIRANRSGERQENVTVSVSDTGIGIPQDMLTTIFDPFVQVESSPSRRGEGTGLGLAISRDLAQGMNGTLTATSTPGAGSTFYLTLPAAPATAVRQPTAQNDTL
jgi:PAS domain S-box-containing protein